MPNSNSTMIHKLQVAINGKGEQILYNTKQFFSEKENRPVTVYIIRKPIYNSVKGRFVTEELFSSTSQIQIVLFLRDYWYKINGWNIPHDNKLWEDAKKKYYEKNKTD